ncbi:class I SAM-dependent methyltransferase [Actinospongicola halichondriae]|uniref:class I SAM-dependent methyltransferase n=1 Tax=Actinospongicola halichondriae TaxID=3236844 RepID=UPI003D50B6DD
MARSPRTTPEQLSKARLRSWVEGKILDLGAPQIHAQHGARKAEVLGAMTGTVVEIGPGTGPNMRYYAPGVKVIAIEPNPNMHDALRASAAQHDVDLEIRTVQGERIDVDDDTADGVVGTLVLCGVDDPEAVVAEIRRVLKPGGTYFFLEHVAAEPGSGIRRVQDLVHRPHRWMANGCETNRDTAAVIDAAGFSAVDHETIDVGRNAAYTRIQLVGTATE